MRKLKIAILISGRGSNMGALARAAMDPDFAAEIVLVISNRPNVAGIDLAMEYDLPFRVIDHKPFGDRQSHENAMSEALQEAGVELICLAGFMRIFSDNFISTWRGKILNIHPSLLPSFRGIDTHERALDRGVRIYGCTVHFVNGELDGGPIILQGALPVAPGEDAASLAARVLELEHELYPRALGLIASGKIRWSGDSAVLDVDVGVNDVAQVNPADGVL